MKLFKFFFPVLVLAVGVGVFTYLKNTKPIPEPLETKLRSPVVTGQKVNLVSAAPVTRLFGRVESPRSSLITSAIEADVIRVDVLEGQSVQSGQWLVGLDDIDIKLDILQREAELADIQAQIESNKIQLKTDRAALATERALLSLIRKSVERAKTLMQTQSGSQAALDEALQNEQRQLLVILQRQKSIDAFPSRQLQLEARKQKAEAILKKSENDLGRTVISAATQARIVEVMVSPGDRVSRGGPLIRLYNQGDLEVRVQVSAGILPLLQNALDHNQPIEATALYDTSEIRLVLDRLSSRVTEGQGGVDAFFRSKTESLPVVGMTLEINLRLPVIDHAIVVSADAIYGNNRAYRIIDNRLDAVTVTILGEKENSDGQRVLILNSDDLKSGDTMMVSRLPQAIHGLAVDIDAMDPPVDD